MHFAFIRFSSLGDVVLQTSLISWIKLQFPASKITFITSEGFSSLVKDHKHIDNVLTIKRLQGSEDIRQINKLAKSLSKDYEVDLIIDLHNTLRAKLLKLMCFRVPSITVNKRSFLRKFLVLTKIDLLKNLKPHVERTIQDLSFIFKKQFEREVLEDFLKAETKRSAMGLTSLPWSFISFDSQFTENYIVISPVASFATKRWPIDYVNDLLENFSGDEQLRNLKIIIIAGPDDHYCDEISNKFFESNQALINLQGKTSLEESAKILEGAKLVITNDTGSSHLAESFGTPVLVTFGATSPSFGFRPHLEASRYMYSSIACSPCSETGKKPCVFEELKCMRAISSTDVFEQAKRILTRKN